MQIYKWLSIIIITAYSIWILLTTFGIVQRPRFTRAFVRFIYVALHEASHAFIGVLMGMGVDYLELLPNKEKETAGAYMPRRRSPFRLLFINIGEALMAIAGPILPLLLMYLAVDLVFTGRIEILVWLVAILFIFLIIYSKERWLFIVLTIILVAFAIQGGATLEGIMTHATLIAVVWGMLGMIEEAFIIPKYNRIGSDAGNFTKGLIGVEHPILSQIINIFVLIYHIFMMIQIMIIIIG